MSHSRQLAAIMFTDIVGDTRVMTKIELKHLVHLDSEEIKSIP